MRQRIRAKRKELGMSQAELGRRVDVSRVAICEYEAGRGGLSDQTLERMLDVLGIDGMERAKRDLRRHLDGAARAIDSLQSQAAQ
jgi:transcriptional regulator with XRE-family HTH domain